MVESRLSGSVALVWSSPVMQQFLAAPVEGYVEAWFRFEDNLSSEAIMFIDQEFLEGVASPVYFPGGDWMSFVGFRRDGTVWVAAGTDDTMNGIPSTQRNWQILPLGQPLDPNTGYTVRVESDFGTRHFKSFTITGPDINQTLDLSAYKLDYPQNLPFSGASMGYYTGAMCGITDPPAPPGPMLTYFDKVKGGVMSGGAFQTVFEDGFENQTVVGDQPPGLDLNAYTEGLWYKERAESLYTIKRKPFAPEGRKVGVADVDLGG